MERGDAAAAVELLRRGDDPAARAQTWAMLGRALTVVGRLNEAVEANGLTQMSKVLRSHWLI